jgi:alpha-1,2-mannosyltransferase
MLFQSLSSIIVGFECLLMNATPEVFVDTTGHAFIYPLAYLCGVSKVVAYVHYPIISSDMLNKVREQRPSYNNDSRIASSVTISKLKLFYYNFFAKLYSFVGSFADNVMVNSSWTAGHMSHLWNRQINNNNSFKLKKDIIKLFPPCNTSHLQQIPLRLTSSSEVNKSRERIILSIGQFRPEKDHFLQLTLFKELLLLGESEKESEEDSEFVLVEGNNNKYSDVRLVLLGSVRHKEDEELVNKLKKQASLLGIEDNVDFVINAPYSQMLEYLRISSIGLHTMWNEHFGISIVEMMAAGLVVVAHKSAGPLMDIVIPIDNEITGYLASSPAEYAQCIREALDNFENLLTLRERGRLSCSRFSDENFTNITISEFTNVIDSFYEDDK